MDALELEETGVDGAAAGWWEDPLHAVSMAAAATPAAVHPSTLACVRFPITTSVLNQPDVWVLSAPQRSLEVGAVYIGSTTSP